MTRKQFRAYVRKTLKKAVVGDLVAVQMLAAMVLAQQYKGS